MAVEYFEWTPFDAQSGTGQGDVIDLRGLNISRLWFEFDFSSTGTCTIFAGLDGTTFNQNLGLTDVTGGVNDTSISNTDEAVYVNSQNPVPPFILPNISANGGTITLRIYGEARN